MPFYLAVLSPNKAEKIQSAYPEIEKWAIAGHSLGGAMAARYVYAHPGAIDGLLLWDAYPPDTDDLSDRELPVTLIHRSDESGAPPDYYSKYLPSLPGHTELNPIIGASHINFGNFDMAQRFKDMPPAQIPIDIQHQKIAEATIEFLKHLE